MNLRTNNPTKRVSSSTNGNGLVPCGEVESLTIYNLSVGGSDPSAFSSYVLFFVFFPFSFIISFRIFFFFFVTIKSHSDKSKEQLFPE